MIPIIIICYNNYRYVENTVNQIKKTNEEYSKYIYILDNSSTDLDTIHYLNNCSSKVILNKKNDGPWISNEKNSDIYNMLPEQFILTDPDLEFNENLPQNFIEIMVELSNKYNCNKLGFALDISDFDKMYKNINNALRHHMMPQNLTIYDVESKYWNNKILDDDYELYEAIIDTTFCLINKNYNNNNIRIAGKFTAKHIPWYINNKIYNVYQSYLLNKKQTHISSISLDVIPYIEENYLKIHKNNEFFFIKNDTNNQNLSFWRDIYTNWENETFSVFDRFLDKNKIMIDIGGWIGTTSMYGSRKSKHVYCVEAEKKSFDDMTENFKNNCEDNYTLINKAIYNVSDLDIRFGKNMFSSNTKIGDSGSHIYDESIETDDYDTIKTITMNDLIIQYNIDICDISLIKVDIEGGEECILQELYELHKKHNIPVYISFHYCWWKNKDLNRFEFLKEHEKNTIYTNPFASILLF